MRRRSRALDGLPLYDATVDVAGGVRDLPVPADVRARLHPVRAPAATPSVLWLWEASPSRRFLAGDRDPAGPTGGSAGSCSAALDWPLLYAIKLGQVGPLLFLLFAVGWRWLDRPVPLGLEHGGRRDDQGPAAHPAGVGGPDGSLAGGGRRARRSLVAAALVATVVFGPGVWADYVALLRPGQLPGHDAAQLHARRDRLPGRESPRAPPLPLQIVATVGGRRRSSSCRSYRVGRGELPDRGRRRASCCRRWCGTTTRSS